MSPAKGQPSLGSAVDAYLRSGDVASTRRNRADALEPMRDHFGADLPLAELGQEAVGEWLADKWGHASVATRNMRLDAVRAAWLWWSEPPRRWVAEDRTALGKRTRKRPVWDVEVLTTDEVTRLLDTCNNGDTGIRNRALITLLYRSGLRIGEVLALKPSDIDMVTHSVRVLNPKSGSAQTRGFHPTADDALNRWIDTRRDLGVNGHHTLFCSLFSGHGKTPAAGKLSDRYVRDMLKRAAAEAGIVKRVHPHGFRHTFAAELEARGVPMSTISKLLGHASVATTANYLDHLTNHQAVSALAELDLPGIGGEKEDEPAPEVIAAIEANPDLRMIREILGNREAAATLAKMSKSAAERKTAWRRRTRNFEAERERARLRADAMKSGEFPAALAQAQAAVEAGGDVTGAALALRAIGASLYDISSVIGVSRQAVAKMLGEGEQEQ